MSSTTSTYFCVLTIRKHLLKMRFERSGRGQEPSRGHKFSILENFLSIRDFTSQTLASFPSDLVGVALVGATPLHLLSQTVLPLKSPTGAFIAALRKRGLCVLSAAVEGDKRPGKAPFAGVVFCLIRQPRQKASRLVLWGWHQPPLWRCFIFSCTPFFF